MKEFKVDGVWIRVEYDKNRESHMRWKAQFTHFNMHKTIEYGDTMVYAIGRCFQSAAEMQKENIGCRLYAVRHVVLDDVPEDEYDIKKITDAEMEIFAEKISDGLDWNGGFITALESALPCFDKKEDALNEGE